MKNFFSHSECFELEERIKRREFRSFQRGRVWWSCAHHVCVLDLHFLLFSCHGILQMYGLLTVICTYVVVVRAWLVLQMFSVVDVSEFSKLRKQVSLRQAGGYSSVQFSSGFFADFKRDSLLLLDIHNSTELFCFILCSGYKVITKPAKRNETVHCFVLSISYFVCLVHRLLEGQGTFSFKPCKSKTKSNNGEIKLNSIVLL